MYKTFSEIWTYGAPHACGQTYRQLITILSTSTRRSNATEKDYVLFACRKVVWAYQQVLQTVADVRST